MTQTQTKTYSKERLVLPSLFNGGLQNALKNYLVPPACPLCYTPLAEQKGLCVACWQRLQFITPPLCYKTGVPIPYDLGEKSLSLGAIVKPPRYDRARAALHYKGPAARLIRLMKFYDHPHMADIFGAWMAQAGNIFWEDDGRKTIMMPVPLHRNRLLLRRYNQAAELCRAIVDAQPAAPPIMLDGLVRTKAARQQASLSKAARRRNLKTAFAVRDEMREQIKGARIVLVDDVITTATTIDVCAKILKRAGAAQVDVLAAAIVVLPTQI